MTLTPQITELIQDPDLLELVGSQIAGILVTESAGQQALAVAASLDPSPWKLRVFQDASNPWGEFIDPSDPAFDGTPVIDVSFSNDNFDPSSSNAVKNQRTTATFNIDCYGVGVSAATVDGHAPGDQGAAAEAKRACRLVRKILMAGVYTYLGLQKKVWKRFPLSRTELHPPPDVRAAQNIVCMRLAFNVDFAECSPQVEGQIIESVIVTVRRAENGAVVLVEEIPTPAP